jgi:CyaY protein
LPAGRQYKQQGHAGQAYNPFDFQHTHILLAMTDSEYLTHAEALLKAVEAGCDRINDISDADVDNQRVGGMITLSFANRSQIIINLQKPLHEVWMATKAGGFHYKFDSVWRSTREGSEFFSDLSRHASAQSGLPLVFNS